MHLYITKISKDGKVSLGMCQPFMVVLQMADYGCTVYNTMLIKII